MPNYTHFLIDTLRTHIDVLKEENEKLREENKLLKGQVESYKDAHERFMRAVSESLNEKHPNANSGDSPKKAVSIGPKLSKAQKEIKNIKYGILPPIRREDD